MRTARQGFTLLELLIAVSVIGLLAALLLPALSQAREKARAAVCASNLRQLSFCVQMYLDDHGRFFPYYTTAGGDRLWYFGLESPYNPGGAPGARHIDLTQAKLYPYFRGLHSIEVCPSYDYRSPRWRQKFDQITDGYGLNLALFNQAPNNIPTGLDRVICFADAAQVNTFQAPASSANPMLEEFYYVSANPADRTAHFRHGGWANALFCDGHVKAVPMYPGSLNPALPDARVGRLDPSLFW